MKYETYKSSPVQPVNAQVSLSRLPLTTNSAWRSSGLKFHLQGF